MTVECDGSGNTTELSNWLASIGTTGAASDDCSGITWTNNFTALSDLCGATGSAFVTFTATDECGLTSTTSRTFTIEDTTDPAWVTPPADMTVECDGTADPSGAFAAWLVSFSGGDICGTAAVTDNSAGLSDDCGATGTETVTFTLTDDCGNFITMDATFTIEDTIDPVRVTELIEELKSEDFNIVASACNELGKGKAIEAVDPLIERLYEAPDELKIYVIWALGEIRDKRC